MLTLLLHDASPATVRCPACSLPLASAPEPQPVACGKAHLSRWRVACPCGHPYAIAVACEPTRRDRERAANIVILRAVRRHLSRTNPDREIATTALRAWEAWS